MIHVDLNLKAEKFLRDIEMIAFEVNSERKKYFYDEVSGEVSAERRAGSLGYFVVRVHWSSKKKGAQEIDFYIALENLYVVGFDPNPGSGSEGVRYYIGELAEQYVGLPQGKTTTMLDLLRTVWEDLDKKNNVPVREGVLFSNKSDYRSLSYADNYASRNLFGDTAISNSVEILTGAVENLDSKKDHSEYCRALATLIVVVSESIRFFSISEIVEKVLRDGKSADRVIEEILAVVREWSNSTESFNRDVRVPCFIDAKKKDSYKIKSVKRDARRKYWNRLEKLTVSLKGAQKEKRDREEKFKREYAKATIGVSDIKEKRFIAEWLKEKLF